MDKSDFNDEDRFDQEMEALNENISYLYKKNLEQALQEGNYFKAEFILRELNSFTNTHLIGDC